MSTSVTVIVNESLPLLPCVSVAVQVTVVVPTGKLAPEAASQVVGRGPSMLSLADALKVTLFPVATVVVVEMSAGTVTTGGVVSTSVTVILKVSVPVLPCASVALQVTVVGPTGKVAPDAGVQVGVREPSRLSVAVAEKVTTLPAATVVVARDVGGSGDDGRRRVDERDGDVNEVVPVLPCASVAVQVTVVVPTGKFAPEPGEHDGVMEPSMLSVADAEKVTLFPEVPVVVVVMSAGAVTTGFVVSTTVTVNEAGAGVAMRVGRAAGDRRRSERERRAGRRRRTTE